MGIFVSAHWNDDPPWLPAMALRQRETHPVCLSYFAESATEAISLALHSVLHVFHLALTYLS